MVGLETIESLSKKYLMSTDDFLKLGFALAIKERKKMCRLSGLKYFLGTK